MKVFNNFDNWPNPVEKKGQVMGPEEKGREKEKTASPTPERAKAKGRGARDIVRREKPEATMSSQEIREKVEVHQQANANRMAQKRKAIVDSTMPEIEVEEKPVVGDIRKNDPNDPATVGKLKDLLGKGAVQFSEEQRQVLSKIVGERS